MIIENILETIMIIMFGVSWPFNIIKSIRLKTAKGKSVIFLICILVGYFAGIARKIIISQFDLAFIFYIINTIMVTTDTVLYFINKKRDEIRDAQK